MREIEDGMGFSGYGKPSYEERLEIENGKLQKKLETARRNEQKMREALEFYDKLPMSEQDQLWTQELADKCIQVAKETLGSLEEW